MNAQTVAQLSQTHNICLPHFVILLITAHCKNRCATVKESSGEESSGKYYFVCVWTALNEKKSLYYNFIITKNVNFCTSKLLMSSKLNTKYNS